MNDVEKNAQEMRKTGQTVTEKEIWFAKNIIRPTQLVILAIALIFFLQRFNIILALIFSAVIFFLTPAIIGLIYDWFHKKHY